MIQKTKNPKDGMIFLLKLLILMPRSLKIGMMILMENGKHLKLPTLNTRDHGHLKKLTILPTKDLGFILKLTILIIKMILNFMLLIALNTSVLTYGKLNQDLSLVTSC
jgi:hypothetical protein